MERTPAVRAQDPRGTRRRLRRLGYWLWLVPAVLLALSSGLALPRVAVAGQIQGSITPTTAQAGIPTNFTLNSVPGCGIQGGTTTTTWSWGDGQTTSAVGFTNSHVYAGVGTYSILAVYGTDACGNSSTTSASVSVTQGAGAGSCLVGSSGLIVSVVASPSTASANTPVQFIASQTGASGIVTYSWNFGDGTAASTTTTQSNVHSYGVAGTFATTVTASDQFGHEGCGSTTVSVSTTGASTGNVHVTANGPYTGAVAQPISFSGLGISVTGGVITTNNYQWSFGDGTPQVVGQSVTHSYTQPGTFTVTLTVTDSTGASGSATAISTITGTGTGAIATGGTNTANGVTANTGGPYTGSAGTAINFNATASTTNPGASIASYVWSFGDNSAGTGQTTTHTYSSNGTFTVALTVTDSTGAVVTASTVLNIAGGNRSVALVNGCSNIASTFPDNTPTQTIVNAVTPASALLSVWKLADPLAVKYRGYFPGASQASDLQTVNHLDAIFVCTSASATLAEPSS